MSLSADTLFHFTRKEEFLLGILEKGFLPRYCLENVSYYRLDRDPTQGLPSTTLLGIPMVCFCDIRLTQTRDHTATYGRFAIGMTKAWGIRNLISPVAYFHQNSIVTNQIARIQYLLTEVVTNMAGKSRQEIASGNINLTGIPASLDRTVSHLAALSNFYKPIMGKVIREGKETDVYFYDEREWRYFPYYTNIENAPTDIKLYLLEDEFNNEIVRLEAQNKLQDYAPLKFNKDDISYVILPSKDDLDNFETRFKSLRSKIKFKSIMPKIRYYEEIERDN